ncbi:unnamed protein product [Sphenostylis stenocarpa]|uniref:Nucleobase-ascorbate transporter 10 n=1 Tax=Sphenostylis stenocarpa TaxID=92480 RepID=A0AA86TMC7_9FABA|nr:unnamed protein product [Sphenostylis stenocarpa]
MAQDNAACNHASGVTENKGGGGGGGGESNKNASAAKKVEEVKPHAVHEQLPGIQYCIKSTPPWREAMLLGFQHYLLTLGVTVLIPTILVPQMGGGVAEKARVFQTLLFVSGISTLLQSLFGTRLPIVVVGSYTYIIPITSIIQARRYNSYTDSYERFIQTMRAIQGSLIITACFQMAVGFFGFWRNAVRFFSPLSVVPYITFTGLSLYRFGFPMVTKCVEIGLPTLVIFVFISQASSWSFTLAIVVDLFNLSDLILYANHYIGIKKLMYDRYSVLFTVTIAWLFALFLTSCTVYNHKSESTQNNCRTDRAGLVTAAPWVYFPGFFQWGAPTFHAGEALAMIAASFVSFFEYTGTCYAAARYGSATPVPPSVIGRGSGWVGVSALLSGVFGSITGFTASVDNAGLLALTKAGSRRVVQISSGFMIFFSIFGMFNDAVTVMFMSHTTVAALVAFVLDVTLSREDDCARKDIGLQWWERFSLYSADIKNDEFYSLPCRLDKLFPPS